MKADNDCKPNQQETTIKLKMTTNELYIFLTTRIRMTIAFIETIKKNRLSLFAIGNKEWKEIDYNDWINK